METILNYKDIKSLLGYSFFTENKSDIVEEENDQYEYEPIWRNQDLSSVMNWDIGNYMLLGGRSSRWSCRTGRVDRVDTLTFLDYFFPEDMVVFVIEKFLSERIMTIRSRHGSTCVIEDFYYTTEETRKYLENTDIDRAVHNKKILLKRMSIKDALKDVGIISDLANIIVEFIQPPSIILLRVRSGYPRQDSDNFGCGAVHISIIERTTEIIEMDDNFVIEKV